MPGTPGDGDCREKGFGPKLSLLCSSCPSYFLLIFSQPVTRARQRAAQALPGVGMLRWVGSPFSPPWFSHGISGSSSFLSTNSVGL